MPDSVLEAERRRALRLRRQQLAEFVQDASSFSEHDLDANQKLDFEEFLAMQPRKLREQFTPKEIRVWFNAADENRDGTLSVNEFFAWSMSNCALKYGAMHLHEAFERFDANGHGYCTLKTRAHKHARTHALTHRCLREDQSTHGVLRAARFVQ